MSPKPLIQVIGSLNTDVVVQTPCIPDAGETVTGIAFSLGVGGKGANQAVACGRAAFTSRSTQDAEVQMIGCIGANDKQLSSMLRPILDASGVSMDKVLELEGAQTGTSTILVEPSGANRIMFYPGANYDGMLDHTRILNVATDAGKRYPDVVVLQGEIPRESTIELLRHFNADAVKTQVIFNPAPVFTDGLPVDCLRNLAFLIVNETECVVLAKLMEFASFPPNFDAESLTPEMLHRIADAFFLRAGVRHLIVTLGSRGAYIASPVGTREVVPSAEVERVVDTTAAGDTFAGYIAAFVARHVALKGSLEAFDLRYAVEKANRAAGKCVEREGSMKSIPFSYE